jgi:hypothetical protein
VSAGRFNSINDSKLNGTIIGGNPFSARPFPFLSGMHSILRFWVRPQDSSYDCGEDALPFFKSQFAEMKASRPDSCG